MEQMKNYKQLIKELPSKTIVFAFGRFNPPTIGHELLIKAVKKLAQQKNADHVIYASGSQDAKKNPLSVDKKVKYLKLMFKGTNFAAAGGDARTFIEAAKKLNKKYKNIVMVAGSDRVPEFKRLLNTYNGKDFHFDTIEVISAGERDPDSDDATGMSASKMRAVAAKSDYSQFKKGLPSSMREIDGRRLMNDVRQGMGLEAVTEHLNLAKDELREQYFRGEIFNIGDIVESSDVSYEIVKRGTNHLLLKEESGALVSKWIQDVKLKEPEMNEELTQKTLKSNDKIKVARVIATMLGAGNVEASANPEMIVNLGLRKIRSKALNPEALSVVGRMLKLASSLGIEYDNALVPSKLKEAVMQPSGTDKIETAGPVDLMRFKSYSGKIGHTLHHDETQNADQVRKMKIKQQLGEKSNVEKEMLDVKHAREKESLAKKHEREKASVSEELEENHLMDYRRYTQAAKNAKSKGDHDIAKDAEQKASKAAASYTKVTGKKPTFNEEADLNEDVYAKSEENKRSADAAKKQGDMFAHHLHMSDYHDNLSQWHSEKGRHGEADKHAAKSEDHHEKAMSLKEEVELDESQADHWKKVQSMDKGSVTGGKEAARKKLDYLRAVHDYHKKYGNDTKKVKGEIERINRSRLAEVAELEESADAGLAAKSKKSGISIGTLRKVYNRGMAAWKTGHRPGTTPQQWGMARVNSYISKGSGTYGGADKDLREEELQENNLPKVPKDKESGLPKKYVAGVSDSTAKARAAHFDKNKGKSDSDAAAYEPAPGDATAKTKESEHTKKYRAMYGEDMDEEIYEACWDSHKQVGLKKKGDKMVPDCVPKNEEVVDEGHQVVAKTKQGETMKSGVYPTKEKAMSMHYKMSKSGQYKSVDTVKVEEVVNEDICPECREEPCSCSGAGIQSPAFDPFFKESVVDVTDYEEKWEEHLFATEEPTDEEIEHFMNHLSDNEIYDLYDDDELALVDDETGEEVPEEDEEKSIDEQALFEVLSRMERMKAKFRIRKTKAKRERATKIALRKRSTTQTINKRSRRLAIKLMKKRLLRGRDPSKISVGEKERVERTIATRKKIIDRLAMRLTPRVRKIETSRLNHTKFTGASNVAI